ncbi:hypothetical protein ILYODFUR_006199 [Ilyodon furcidens]|uniref:Uncharacterized protein n=1 Tax=Ilyodon furcidens TaxID=33524 RepID=A0ABV0SKZ9_9TELE
MSITGSCCQAPQIFTYSRVQTFLKVQHLSSIRSDLKQQTFLVTQLKPGVPDGSGPVLTQIVDLKPGPGSPRWATCQYRTRTYLDFSAAHPVVPIQLSPDDLSHRVRSWREFQIMVDPFIKRQVSFKIYWF